jgi:hypothetical protein
LSPESLGTATAATGNISSSNVDEVLTLVFGGVELSPVPAGVCTSTLGTLTAWLARGEEMEGRESSSPGMMDSCIAVARNADVEEESNASGRDG